MDESWKHHPVAELEGHPVNIAILCDCTRVLTREPAYFVELMGPTVTIAEAERRMICGTCKQRARLSVDLEWSVSGGRDTRVNPPPLPAWVPLS